MHRHIYKLAGQFSYSEGKGVAYEDWACIKPNCDKVLRRSFTSPPGRRVVESWPEKVTTPAS